ncbi:MAG: response regulator [Treponema sp.]|jgi:signal transduction histidine kinase/CheY-like chemotaxis protein/HPt (histidine-containing phosphotransfer) domain-containing protein|nr:response regulator [Treponema sp.]
MRSIIKTLWKVVTHVQVLVVFLAFALMVFISYYFMSGIERKHMLRDVDNAIANTQAHIEADLLEPEATLGIIAENIRDMILNGASFDEVSKYIKNTTKYITSDEQMMSYVTRVYGVFDSFGGKMSSGTEWIQPDDYVPQERPWYKTALEAKGKVGITEPYQNRIQNDTCITFSRQIFDDDGNQIGIICLDILLDRIREYAVNTFVTEGSYGVLMDSNYNVIAHPHPSYLGKHMSQINDGPAIQDDLEHGLEVSERMSKDFNGNASVLFIRQLKNGWYMAIIAYAKKYYQSVTDIGFILVVLGLVLAAVLSAILLNIVHARKKAEERTRVMLDATPLCANFWDRNFNNIDCSQEAVKMFGLSSKKEYLERFGELSPAYQPDGKPSKEKGLEYVQRAYEEGHCRFEWLHCNLKGELIPCEITLVRVNYRNEYMVCGYTRDLRELKSMMTKMREADECTQVLFDATPLSCFMVDNQSRLLECNQETVRLFGLADKNEYINNFFNFFPEYQPSGEISREKFSGYLNEAFNEGYCRFEWMHQKLSGEAIPTEVTLVRVKFRSEYAVAGYIRDLRELKAMIAEMRRAEIAEESNKAKSEFLAKMSHEIRTPMNAILGITEIQLQDETLPSVTKDALERIYNSGDLLLGIINDILDLSKIEAGKLELVPVQYEIASLIHDTVKLNVMRYEGKAIEFVLNVDENIPAVLIGDELRLKQILNNLISNAFKYTYEGMINMSISLDEQSSSGTSVMLVFTVSDTGQGMTGEQVRKLGDKFARFNMEANRKTEGTGLGMNITRNLIELMKGELSVESTPGMGSIFKVRLPQTCAGFAPLGKKLADNLMQLNIKNTAKMRNAQIAQEFMPYGRVLVVDDVETNLYVARGLMSPYGLSIDTALSGFEAVEKIRGGFDYDIIFMDHMMPRMDGIETVKIIRGLGYARPIIALTANALAGQAEMFLKNGFDDFISKPIDIRQLNAALNKYVRDIQPPEVIEESRRQKSNMFPQIKTPAILEPQLAEFFVRDAEKALSVLEAICRNKCRRGDDIPVLVINVHAMKSALANIGEAELSLTADKIEKAGRDRDITTLLDELPAFLEFLKNVVERLKSAEDENEEELSASGAEIDRPFLREKLLAIKDACASLDKKTAKAALAELKQKIWPRSIKEQLSAIAERLLHSEFDEAAVIAQETSEAED